MRIADRFGNKGDLSRRRRRRKDKGEKWRDRAKSNIEAKIDVGNETGKGKLLRGGCETGAVPYPGGPGYAQDLLITCNTVVVGRCPLAGENRKECFWNPIGLGWPNDGAIWPTWPSGWTI